jgi:hypothetical protein
VQEYFLFSNSFSGTKMMLILGIVSIKKFSYHISDWEWKSPQEIFLTLLLMALFALAVQAMLKIIQPGNRKMKPYQAWLIFIPVFTYFWVFVIARDLSRSVKKEYFHRHRTIKSNVFYFGVVFGMLLLLSDLLHFYNAFTGQAAVICFAIFWGMILWYMVNILRLRGGVSYDGSCFCRLY